MEQTVQVRRGPRGLGALGRPRGLRQLTGFREKLPPLPAPSPPDSVLTIYGFLHDC